MTADPTRQELNIGERADYTRAHLPATQRERYEQELREATERALAMGDYGPLGNVVERWWRAARLIEQKPEFVAEIVAGLSPKGQAMAGRDLPDPGVLSGWSAR